MRNRLRIGIYSFNFVAADECEAGDERIGEEKPAPALGKCRDLLVWLLMSRPAFPFRLLGRSKCYALRAFTL